MSQTVYDKSLDRHVPVGPNGEPVVIQASDMGTTSWAVSQQSAANTALTLSRPAEVGKAHRVQSFEVVVGGADATVSITVVLRLGATVAWRTRLRTAGAIGERVNVTFPVPLEAPENAAVSLDVSAGGLGVITDCNLAGTTK